MSVIKPLITLFFVFVQPSSFKLPDCNSNNLPLSIRQPKLSKNWELLQSVKTVLFGQWYNSTVWIYLTALARNTPTCILPWYMVTAWYSVPWFLRVLNHIVEVFLVQTLKVASSNINLRRPTYSVRGKDYCRCTTELYSKNRRWMMTKFGWTVDTAKINIRLITLAKVLRLPNISPSLLSISI